MTDRMSIFLAKYARPIARTACIKMTSYCMLKTAAIAKVLAVLANVTLLEMVKL